VRELSRIVGDEHVLGGDAAAYLEDASRAQGFRGRADAVVRPGGAEEVAAVVAWCYEHDVAIVPRGGGTGYAGGAVPLDGGVVLALERLGAVRSLDPGLWRMEAEAGVSTATVRRRAREVGLLFPVDPGAAESSQIGGNVATNAGGPHCFKHGVTRAWVTGVEAVLAPGELVRIGGPVRKDVAGYDLVSLLCGAEGTLGVLTGVWLRLVPAPDVALPVVAAFADARGGQAGLEAVLASGVVPGAIEFLDAGALAAAGREGMGFLLVCDVEGDAAGVARERGELAQALREAGGSPVETPDDGRELWRWRDGVSLAVAARRGGKLSEDVAVPLDRLADAVEETVAIGARHDLEACSWGHAGDGNVHATFLLAPGDAAQLKRAQAAAEELFAMAARLGGTVSGEHGLGALKAGQLARQWPPAALEAHRAIKRALDPKGLFNPGKKVA
jgi:glycolate dehydrogenase FAD-linked subunit